MHDGASKIISKSSLQLSSNDTTALTIATSQNSTFIGNVVTHQLVINGVSGIYDESTTDNGTDLRANLRVLANLSTSEQNVCILIMEVRVERMLIVVFLLMV